MQPTIDRPPQGEQAHHRLAGPVTLDPTSRDCLAKTRSAVLNVLVATGLMIAVSGWLLRLRAGAFDRPAQPTRLLHQGLMTALAVVAASSYLARRLLGRRAALRDPSRRARTFFRAHVLPALIAALAAPLGLAYGWFLAPSLESVIPFWVVALALGFLSLPRVAELADFDQTMPHAGASAR
jgi:hypothetical protein